MTYQIIQAALIGFLITFLGPAFMRKFYLRPLAGEAFVRVGLGGSKIVREREGCWYFGLFHILTRIPLTPYQITLVTRSPTRDGYRVTPQINFFIRVNPSRLESAARSLSGEPPQYGSLTYPIRWVTRNQIVQLIEPRLTSAIRRVLASVPLQQVLSSTEWVSRISQALSEDLDHLGLLIDTATVSAIQEN